MPDTTGWGSTFGGRPTAIWVPYTCTTNNGTINITGYTGPGGDVTIPGSINGLPVTSIGNGAFFNCMSLNSVTIPNSVTNIGVNVFGGCANLTGITVNTNNSAFTSMAGVLFNKSQNMLVQYTGNAGSYTIPNGVTSIGDYAFGYCSSLTSVTIPNSITNIAGYAFEFCTNLNGIYFQGNAPGADSTIFGGDNSATVYYPGFPI